MQFKWHACDGWTLGSSILLVREMNRLLYLVKDGIESDQLQDSGALPPWIFHALVLLKMMLRPPEGGGPCLRDHSEQVLSTLKLPQIHSDSRFKRIKISKNTPEWNNVKGVVGVADPTRPIAARNSVRNKKGWQAGCRSDHVLVKSCPTSTVPL